ncbi:sestrin-3-like [Liolophura sinensis]|uniref:sestrin-3-like n=1 Tax=Liolophura sinensis TaxID=3198878 RepID=UPI0031594296
MCRMCARNTDSSQLSQAMPEKKMKFCPVDSFLQNNQLDCVSQIMGYHPQYLESFLKTQQQLLHGDGPLPFDYRHYIGVMAAARHQCDYLVKQQTTEFVLAGGDEAWLKGLDYIPQKLRNLYEVNKLLAHRPWMITKDHIEKLTRGQDNWSLSEVMHALILLAHFHSLCSFVSGCDIRDEEIEETSTSTSSNNNVQMLNCNNSADVGIAALMERMKKLTEESKDQPSQEEMLKRFEKVETQSLELTLDVAHPSPRVELLKYVEDSGFVYEDFAKRGCESEKPTFRAQDFSWEDHGFSLANRLYSGIGNLLEDKFRVAYNLTYYTMGHNTDVDTTSFRRAIWNYIHCMYGIRHDDYNYGEVNQLLERNLKAYIKTVTCYPERTTKKDIESVMREFLHSEKVHVNLMLFEARLQGELLYALRAVNNYLT